MTLLDQHVQDLEKDGEARYGLLEWSRLLLVQDRTEWIKQLWRFDTQFQLMVEMLIRKHLVASIKSSPNIILLTEYNESSIYRRNNNANCDVRYMQWNWLETKTQAFTSRDLDSLSRSWRAMLRLCGQGTTPSRFVFVSLWRSCDRR